MRVNIVSPAFAWYRGYELYAGGQVILWELTRLLAEKGHQVTVIQWGDDLREFDFHHVRIRQVPVPEPRFLVRMGITRLFQTYGFYWRRHLDPDADLVHLHYYNSAFPFATGEMTGMCHGIDWDCPDTGRRRDLRALRDRFHLATMKAIARFAVRRLGRIAANDLFFLKFVQSEMPAHREKVWHIPNFVDDRIFNESVKPSAEIAAAHDGRFRVLIPKFVMHQRGQHLAIQALSRLGRRDVVLLLAGEPPGGKEARYYEALIAEHAGPGQVVYLGHRDHFKEMPGLYRAADAVLVPSHCREATALSLLEGMACGRPVMVTNVGGLTDAVVDGLNGVVRPPTPDGIASGLRLLMDDPRLASSLAAEGRNWARRFYGLDVWRRRWLEFLGLDGADRGSAARGGTPGPCAR